jgi:hypothetical protein
MKIKTLAALGTLAAVGTVCCAYENNALTVDTVTIRRELPQPLTIVNLSDLHGKSFGKNSERLLAKVAALAPDLIVMTGDTVSASGRGIGAMTRLASRLTELAPVAMIPGNHERRSGRMEELLSRFSSVGVHVLENEQLDLVLRGTAVHILGLAEPIAVSRWDYLRAAVGRLQYPDNDDALLSLAKEDGLRIVLTHFPELFAGIGKRSYRRFSFDLLLAGHAHGGQFRLPGLGALYAPGQGFFPKYTAGLYGGGPYMVVSRGLGNDSVLPRVGNRPEISCIRVI